MHTYSHFFETLHDERLPVGHLGRGTHYSVFRAAVFHNELGKSLSEIEGNKSIAKYHDFAVIWDEDHDERVFEVIEKIYFLGLLPLFCFFGERKGGFTALTLNNNEAIYKDACNIIEVICQDLEDPWSSEIGFISNPVGIIADITDDVILYLKTVNMLWTLGSKNIKQKKSEQTSAQDIDFNFE